MQKSSLSDAQFQSLLSLSKKQAGQDVEFINIADARALTDLGFAARTQQGWVITEAGSTVVATEEAGGPTADVTLLSDLKGGPDQDLG